jgi:hypothetical protein
MSKKNCATSIAQKSPSKGRQLDLFTHTGNLHKPQIASIPGISPKERDRYRVVLGSKILGDHLSIDEALQLAQGGKR